MTGRYKAYPEYKDSENRFVQHIPKHWSRVIVGGVSDVIDPQPDHRAPAIAKDGQGFPYIGIRDVNIDGTLNFSTARCVEESAVIKQERSFRIKVNDIVFCKVGTLGEPRKIKPHGRCALSATLVLIKASSKIDSQYLLYALDSYPVQSQTDLLATGSTRAALGIQQIRKFQIPFAPLKEQQKIASFLDHETVKLDTLIAKQEKLIKLLKEKRQAVISHAVTKGLNPDAPMKDSGVEWLGGVPEHWEVMRLKHLIKSLESGCSVNAADVPAKENELGVLKTSCVYTRRFRASENKTVVVEELSRVKCPVRKGAIIISRMNTPELVGASALVDTKASNLFLPDRLWQTIFDERFEVNSEFLAHFMTVEGFRNQISLSAEGASSSMQNIAKEDYLSINVLLPKREEQTQIVSYIKESEANFLRLETKALNAIQLMKERKTALISAAVTGKIDVRNWAVLDKDQG
ncbi:restriction endonuclease subunit S [Vibrio splendidus]|uniref:Type I restriction modification DNA specificity domain-containing protein n=1 Tax=Vibrio splendidus TaxID=29497 RepID=A0A2N7K018_VIBSP|nr:restriction endonuclease subunit S [Vibrio splendidus]PMM66289.1 hypothetical protein BCT54_15980 [Vibrio splendidus]